MKTLILFCILIFSGKAYTDSYRCLYQYSGSRSWKFVDYDGTNLASHREEFLLLEVYPLRGGHLLKYQEKIRQRVHIIEVFALRETPYFVANKYIGDSHHKKVSCISKEHGYKVLTYRQDIEEECFTITPSMENHAYIDALEKGRIDCEGGNIVPYSQPERWRDYRDSCHITFKFWCVK